LLRLHSKEFIRRFQLHILAKGYTQMRHYGFLSSRWKKEKSPQLHSPTSLKEVSSKLRIQNVSYSPLSEKRSSQQAYSIGLFASHILSYCMQLFFCLKFIANTNTYSIILKVVNGSLSLEAISKACVKKYFFYCIIFDT